MKAGRIFRLLLAAAVFCSRVHKHEQHHYSCWAELSVSVRTLSTISNSPCLGWRLRSSDWVWPGAKWDHFSGNLFAGFRDWCEEKKEKTRAANPLWCGDPPTCSVRVWGTDFTKQAPPSGAHSAHFDMGNVQTLCLSFMAACRSIPWWPWCPYMSRCLWGRTDWHLTGKTNAELVNEDQNRAGSSVRTRFWIMLWVSFTFWGTFGVPLFQCLLISSRDQVKTSAGLQHHYRMLTGSKDSLNTTVK